ncbi:MAG: FAD-binding oxidoreductase [Solirubrobacterales bacterium]|nr:FAD-binding oxidoreductase [Solirubrobacterales bacterium]
MALIDPQTQEQPAMATIDQSPFDTAALAAGYRGDVLTPGHPDYDRARQAFNVTADQRPAAVAFPTDEDDVVALVAFARRQGLQLAAQATGHNALPLGDLSGTMLVKTTRMKGVEIDAAARIARVRAGAIWEDVTGPACALGLACLHGSSPDVGIVGYSLGGGMGWYARRFGMAANHVTAIELVTADGRLVRATHDHEPELFWALRGGGGNFGIVTALEFRLFPVPEVYAGALFFDWERAAEVLHAWHELLPGLPDEITSVGRLLQVPPMPEIPEPIGGRSFVVIEAAYLGTQVGGEALLAPLRALGPEIDTFAMLPPAGLAELHMDPRDPMPVISGHELLDELPGDAIDALLAVTGPGSGSPLVSVELRHTGGSLARPADHHGARDTLAGSLCLFALGVPFDEAGAVAVHGALAAVADAVAPYAAGCYLNFVEHECDTARAFDEDSWRRLTAVKAAYDPTDLFRGNHPVGARR